MILGSVAALTYAGALSASEPTRTTEIVHRRLDPWFPCPGFDIVGEFDLIREVTTYYDHDGVAVRRSIHVDVAGTLTHAGTGESLPTSGVGVFHFDLTADEAFFAGSNNVTQLPDGGVSYSGTRHFVCDSQGQLIDFHGPPDGELDDPDAALATGQ